jgi:hypothetical protein
MPNGHHPNSRKALARYKKDFVKGVGGNPSGRPKRHPISDALRNLADLKYYPKSAKLKHGATYAEAAAFQAFLDAIRGDVKALNEVADRIEGKPSQRIELSGVDDAPPIQINSVDISKLSKDELLAYRAILAKAARRDD